MKHERTRSVFTTLNVRPQLLSPLKDFTDYKRYLVEGWKQLSPSDQTEALLEKREFKYVQLNTLGNISDVLS